MIAALAILGAIALVVIFPRYWLAALLMLGLALMGGIGLRDLGPHLPNAGATLIGLGIFVLLVGGLLFLIVSLRLRSAQPRTK